MFVMASRISSNLAGSFNLSLIYQVFIPIRGLNGERFQITILNKVDLTACNPFKIKLLPDNIQ